MVRRCLCAAVVLLLVVGVAVGQERQRGRRGGRGNMARGTVVSLDMNKDGTGTLTVMARQGRDQEPKEMKFNITKDTKFTKGGGRGQPGTPVEAAKVSDTFKKDTNVAVQFEKKDDQMVARNVRTFTPRRRQNDQ